MATPGAAGVAALMLQANPDLSPFEIRNFMQETAEYRPCTYMGDPDGGDGCDDNDVQAILTKNRQNNVYGHGEVRALDSVLAAAEKYYLFDNSMNIELETVHVHVSVAVLINDSDQVLFGQRPPPKSWEGWWEFPGGKVEKNENFLLWVI